MTQALLVTMEGIDASGKATQADLLADHFHRSQEMVSSGARMSVGRIRFPQYEENFFGGLVRRYLDGEFGMRVNDNHPLLTALLYSFDRWQTKDRLGSLLDAHDLVICDRYVCSNLAHQGAKFPAGMARSTLMNEIAHIEYTVLGLPRPNLVIFLDLPPMEAVVRVAKERRAEGKTGDIHEVNSTYLEAVSEAYHQLAYGNPIWHVIPCMKGGSESLSAEQVAISIWGVVSGHLAAVEEPDADS